MAAPALFVFCERYSPTCREGVFSETRLSASELLSETRDMNRPSSFARAHLSRVSFKTIQYIPSSRIAVRNWFSSTGLQT